jgi:hypothetical protein
MVNNSTNDSKTNNHLKLIEYKKDHTNLVMLVKTIRTLLPGIGGLCQINILKSCKDKYEQLPYTARVNCIEMKKALLY